MRLSKKGINYNNLKKCREQKAVRVNKKNGTLCL